MNEFYEKRAKRLLVIDKGERLKHTNHDNCFKGASLLL